MIKTFTGLVSSSNYKPMSQMLRHERIFQCFVLILALVGQLSVSGFWPFLCPFGCMYFLFLLQRATVQSSYVTIRQKIAGHAFKKQVILPGTQRSQFP